MEGDPAGAIVGAMFKTIIKTADPSRPVVAAMNYDWGIGLSFVLGIMTNLFLLSQCSLITTHMRKGLTTITKNIRFITQLILTNQCLAVKRLLALGISFYLSTI
jgi:hypothetical protein